MIGIMGFLAESKVRSLLYCSVQHSMLVHRVVHYTVTLRRALRVALVSVRYYIVTT
jgi:hypothetical protein